MTAGLEIVAPRGPQDIEAIRSLCWNYREFLLGLGGEDAEIVRAIYPEEKYARILRDLEATHSPPHGALRLALVDGKPAGTAMVQTLAPGDAEIKRVYVAPSARGRGAGRALMEALIETCRELGCSRILMDTGRPLVAAQRLYLDLGFHLRGPYQPLPEIAEGRLLFFEMTL